MFNYLDQFSILNEPEQISSLSYQLDGSGYPFVSWIGTRADTSFLRFCRYDGTEWNFQDLDFSISITESKFDFIQMSPAVYFLHTNLKEAGDNVELWASRYSLNTDKLIDQKQLDSGDIDFSLPFVYSSTAYFAYRKGGVLYAKDYAGNTVFPQLSSLSFGSTVFDIVGSYSQRYFFIFWAEQSGTSVTFKTAMYDLSSNSWFGPTTVSTIETSTYAIACTLNADGDSLTPAPTYKPFYSALSYMEDDILRVMLVEQAIANSGTYLAFMRSYADRLYSFSSDLSVELAVYGTSGLITVSLDDLLILRSSSVPSSFTRVTSPGYKVSKGVNSLVPIISGSTLHYIYVSDNIAYGYAPFSYSPSRLSRSFFVSDGSSSYVRGSALSGLNNHTIGELTYDKNFGSPMLWATKASDATGVYFYDSNSQSFVSDLKATVTAAPLSVSLDSKNSRLLMCNSDGDFASYDLITDTETVYTEYNSTSLSSPLHVSIGDKEVAIVDSGNHRIVILDRNDLGFLREIENDEIRYPYYATFTLEGDLFIKCFDSSSSSIVYRTSRLGDLLKSFPSYTPFSLDVNGVISAESWYTSSFSTPARRFAAIFNGSDTVLCVDENDDSFWTSSFSGYTLYGIDVDDSTGQVFVSAKNGSDADIIIEVEGLTGERIRDIAAPATGIVDVLEQADLAALASFSISDPSYNDDGTIAASFEAVNDESEIASIPFSQSSSSSAGVGLSYVYPVTEERHTYERDATADLWHFRHTGMIGGKVSVNQNLSFAYLSEGSLRKVPVFSWAYQEDKYVDSFFTSDGTTVKKIAAWYNGDANIEEVATFDENNSVTAVYTFEGRVAVSAGGYLSLYAYDTFNRLTSAYFAADVKVYDYRFDKIWAGSKNRGLIWEINPQDLTDFNQFEAKDAPVSMVWSDHYKQFILHCENSLKYLNRRTGAVSSFYDVNDYVIVDIAISGEDVAVGLFSYEQIPQSVDYDTDQDFQIAATNRIKDRVVVLRPNSSKYVFSNDFSYNFKLNSIGFDGENVVAFGSDASNVYVKVFDFDTAVETSYAYSTDASPVDAVFLPLAERYIAVLSDGSFLDWSSGSLVQINASEDDDAEEETVTIASNGMLVKRSEVGGQTDPSSSSSSSSSSGSGYVPERGVQIVVGDSDGGANKWNSGEITTTKTAMLYGGPNNLEPGQRYYASVRVKTSLDQWTEYDTVSFVMPHFENFTYNARSSSSSSSNGVASISTVYQLASGQTINCGTFTEVGILFDGDEGENGYLVVGGITTKIENRSGSLVFDSGGSQEYVFSFVGETYVYTVGANNYPVTWIAQPDLAFSIHSD